MRYRSSRSSLAIASAAIVLPVPRLAGEQRADAQAAADAWRRSPSRRRRGGGDAAGAAISRSCSLCAGGSTRSANVARRVDALRQRVETAARRLASRRPDRGGTRRLRRRQHAIEDVVERGGAEVKLSLGALERGASSASSCKAVGVTRRQRRISAPCDAVAAARSAPCARHAATPSGRSPPDPARGAGRAGGRPGRGLRIRCLRTSSARMGSAPISAPSRSKMRRHERQRVGIRGQVPRLDPQRRARELRQRGEREVAAQRRLLLERVQDDDRCDLRVGRQCLRDLAGQEEIVDVARRRRLDEARQPGQPCIGADTPVTKCRRRSSMRSTLACASSTPGSSSTRAAPGSDAYCCCRWRRLVKVLARSSRTRLGTSDVSPYCSGDACARRIGRLA